MKKLFLLILPFVVTCCGCNRARVEDSVVSYPASESSNSISTSESESSYSSSASSSFSSSSMIEVDAFEEFHNGLALKNSTLVDENYIEQKIIDSKVLTNHYFGKFASQGDDGYLLYLDQGLYHYTLNQNDIRLDDCKSLNKDTNICEFFYTTYDFLSVKSKWKKTSDNLVYTSSDLGVSEIIAELDGQGIYSSVALSASSSLILSNDGREARFSTKIVTDGFGEFEMGFLVKDLGTTKDDKATSFLTNATRLKTTGEFPTEIKSAIKNIVGKDVKAPNNISYAHQSFINKDSNGEISSIQYEDLITGDEVSSYRQDLLSEGFTLSDLTNEKEDLKNLGYARYYYEINVANYIVYVELYFVPKVMFDSYEQGLYPNGIFHLRFIKYVA